MEKIEWNQRSRTPSRGPVPLGLLLAGTLATPLMGTALLAGVARADIGPSGTRGIWLLQSFEIEMVEVGNSQVFFGESKAVGMVVGVGDHFLDLGSSQNNSDALLELFETLDQVECCLSFAKVAPAAVALAIAKVFEIEIELAVEDSGHADLEFCLENGQGFQKSPLFVHGCFQLFGGLGEPLRETEGTLSGRSEAVVVAQSTCHFLSRRPKGIINSLNSHDCVLFLFCNLKHFLFPPK